MIYRKKLLLNIMLLITGSIFCMDVTLEFIPIKNGLSMLPKDIQKEIVSFLSVKDIKNLRLMNKGLKDACKEIFSKQKEDGDKLGLELIKSINHSSFLYPENIVNKIICLDNANFNKCDKYGQTALIICSQKPRSYSIIRKLIEVGAKIDLKDKLGCTALMNVARSGDTKLVELLVGSKSSLCDEISLKTHLDLQDNNGQTALMFACKYSGGGDRYDDIIKFLVESGSNLNIQDNDGQTALMIVCKYSNYGIRYVNIIKFLIKSGSDINIRNKNGQTALDIIEPLNIRNDIQELINRIERNEEEIEDKNFCNLI